MNTAALVVLAFIASPGPAATQAPTTAPSTAIRYADLNLSDPKDADAMLARIRKAAVEVCRASPGLEGADLTAIRGFNDCYHQSVRRAVGDLNAPLVTAAFHPSPGGPVVVHR